MRFKLTLSVDKHAFGSRLPFDYFYECSAAIYRILSRSDAAFSAWLHDNGFRLESGRPFKLFTFSRLQIPQYRVEGNCIHILSDTVDWFISFLPERSTQEFIQGVFREQTFELGLRNVNVRFRVQQIEVLPPPSFTQSMDFETLSPVCISRYRNGKVDYLNPTDPEAAQSIRNNLLNKYKAFSGKDFPADFDFEFTVLSQPKSVLITIKSGTPQQTRIRGFMCRFRVTAPVELMKILYEAGVGEKGSMGFGMVRKKT